MIRALAIVLVASCGGGARTPPPNFELACRASNTATAAELFCVRTDTRDGDVVRVLYDKLPVSSGPTASTAEPPGSYTTVCDATSTTTRSDLYCVRMNTQTGAMLLVNLTKLETIPATK